LPSRAKKRHGDHASAIGAERHPQTYLVGVLLDGIGHHVVWSDGQVNEESSQPRNHILLLKIGCRRLCCMGLR